MRFYKYPFLYRKKWVFLWFFSKYFFTEKMKKLGIHYYNQRVIDLANMIDSKTIYPPSLKKKMALLFCKEDRVKALERDVNKAFRHI